MKLELISIIKNSLIKKVFGGILAVSTLLGGYVITGSSLAFCLTGCDGLDLSYTQ